METLKVIALDLGIFISVGLIVGSLLFSVVWFAGTRRLKCLNKAKSNGEYDKLRKLLKHSPRDTRELESLEG